MINKKINYLSTWNPIINIVSVYQNIIYGGELIGRRQFCYFFLWHLISTVSLAIVLGVTIDHFQLSNIAWNIGFPIILIHQFFWYLMAMGKRCNDIGISKFMIATLVIPLINLLFLIYLMTKRGNKSGIL